MTDGFLTRRAEIDGINIISHLGASASEKLVHESISSQVVDQAKKSTVLVSTSTADGPRGFGSGFITSEGRVVTSLHVVGGARAIEITAPSGEHFAARVEKVDEINDLAVLSVEGMQGGHAVKLGSSENLKPGDNLFSAGHPNGVASVAIELGKFNSNSTYGVLQGPEEAAGWVEAAKDFYGNDKKYLAEAGKFLAAPRVEALLHTDHGNSGGPVQNARGEVIGVATNISRAKPGASFLVPSESVSKLLNNSDQRFNFTYGQESNFERQPLITTARDGALLGLGYKFRTVAAPVVGLAYGYDLYKDVKLATSPDLYGSRTKYVAEAAMDAMAVTGGLLSLNSRTKMLGMGMVGARALIDVGVDFFGGSPVLKKVERTDRAEPQRTGEPLYWSLIDRVNASKQLAPSTQVYNGAMKRH